MELCDKFFGLKMKIMDNGSILSSILRELRLDCSECGLSKIGPPILFLVFFRAKF